MARLDYGFQHGVSLTGWLRLDDCRKKRKHEPVGEGNSVNWAAYCCRDDNALEFHLAAKYLPREDYPQGYKELDGRARQIIGRHLQDACWTISSS